MPILRSHLLAAVVFGSAVSIAQAQPAWPATPENVVQLSASAAVEVPQDVLSIQLQAVRERTDAATVQAELKAAVDAALAQGRRDVRPGAMELRTGSFSIVPRYGRDQRIASWVGTATVVVEGSDTVRVSEVAGRLPGLNVIGAGFHLSRVERDKAQQEAQGQAVARFRAKAADIARSFGFTGYGLREVSVNADEGAPPRPMVAMKAASVEAASQAPVPVEAGKATVVVTVSGSVQLR